MGIGLWIVGYQLDHKVNCKHTTNNNDNDLLAAYYYCYPNLAIFGSVGLVLVRANFIYGIRKHIRFILDIYKMDEITIEVANYIIKYYYNLLSEQQMEALKRIKHTRHACASKGAIGYSNS